jgi:hypothetical protein
MQSSSIHLGGGRAVPQVPLASINWSWWSLWWG